MTGHGVHHYVKYGGGEWIPLGELPVALEQGAIIAPHSSHHKEVHPIVPEDPLHPRSNTVAGKDIQETLPIKGVVGLSEIKETL